MAGSVTTASTSLLPAMVRAAADALARATTAAEVLDARDMAGEVYSKARRAARLMKARAAADELIAAAHRAQADALEIEAGANRRIADEYDAAQDRGEVAKTGKPKNVPDGNDKPATAEDVGLSRKQVFEARQFRDALERDPGAVRAALDEIVASGDEPTRAALKRAIAPAVKSFRDEAQGEKKARRAAREMDLGKRQTALPQKRYGVIVADPEWRFEVWNRDSGMDRAADNHYPTSDLDAICSRDVAGIAAPDCVLGLWATAPMLPQALQVLSAWGFRYVTHVVWRKAELSPGAGTDQGKRDRGVWSGGLVLGTGYWFRNGHELMLIGARGQPVAPAQGEQFPSVIDAPPMKHSQKPDRFLEMLDTYFPSLPKIELNARRQRKGWDAWGLEAPEEAA